MMHICRSSEFVTQLEGVVGGNQLEEGGDDSDEDDNDDTRRRFRERWDRQNNQE